MTNDLSRYPRAEEILEVFAGGAQLQRHRLGEDLRADAPWPAPPDS